MAKENVVPDPIPVRSDTKVTDDDLYCASYLNYAEESFSDTTKDLIHYLESEYLSTGLGGSVTTFIAKDSTVADVTEGILNADIPGITKFTLDKHIILTQPSANDVMISVIMY